MNTGIQRSSATPYGAWTTTTPVKHFKNRPKKDIVAIMAAHRIPYIATASVSHPEDFVKKMKKAKDIKGTRFFHVYAPCPTGWKSRPDDTVKLARMAVQNGYFPLYRDRERGEDDPEPEAQGQEAGQRLPAPPGPLPAPERGADRRRPGRGRRPLGASAQGLRRLRPEQEGAKSTQLITFCRIGFGPFSFRPFICLPCRLSDLSPIIYIVFV